MPIIAKITKNISELIIVECQGGHKIFSCYISPVDSHYSDVSDFAKIGNIFYPKYSARVIIGGGDLNARVGDIKQKLPLNCMYRKNIDVCVNDHGKVVRQMANTLNCFVINNMNIGSRSMGGGVTFQKGERVSRNDIVLTNLSGLSSLLDFQIHRIGWNPSDHAPISVNIELDINDAHAAVAASHDILSGHCINEVRKAKRIKGSLIDWDAYRILVERDFESYSVDVQSLQEHVTLSKLDKTVNP